MCGQFKPLVLYFSLVSLRPIITLFNRTYNIVRFKFHDASIKGKTVKGTDKKHEDVRGMRNSTAATGRSLYLHF